MSRLGKCPLRNETENQNEYDFFHRIKLLKNDEIKWITNFGNCIFLDNSFNVKNY